MMPKEKECWTCSAKQAKLNKLPNGVLMCDDCYAERNPLKQLGGAWAVWKKRTTVYKAHQKEIEKIGKPPIRMDRAYKHLKDRGDY